MKRCLQLFAMLCVMVLGMQISSAAMWENGVHKEDVYNSQGLLDIHTIAIARPMYTKVDEVEPTMDELMELVYEAAGTVDKKEKFKYTSYREVCQGIRVANKIDILRLERHKALKEFKSEIKNYADAYIEVTVSNDTRLNIFYDVYNAKTHELLYSYRKLTPKTSTRDELLYAEMSQDFYKDFLKAVDKAENEKEKEDKAILKNEKAAADKAAKAGNKK